MNKFQISQIESRETCSLSDENLLLSGTVLKNTSEAFGVCVYRDDSLDVTQKIAKIREQPCPYSFLRQDRAR